MKSDNEKFREYNEFWQNRLSRMDYLEDRVKVLEDRLPALSAQKIEKRARATFLAGFWIGMGYHGEIALSRLIHHPAREIEERVYKKWKEETTQEKENERTR